MLSEATPSINIRILYCFLFHLLFLSADNILYLGAITQSNRCQAMTNKNHVLKQ